MATLNSLIVNRVRKEKNRPKELSDDQKKQNIIKWATFYKRNINLYAEQRLQIKLHPFQHVMLYLMNISQVFFAICTRGLSKSFIVGLFAVCKAMLFPYSEIVITATTIQQATKMVKGKIEGEIVKKLSPILRYLWEQGEIKFTYNNDEVRVDFIFNGSWIKVLPSLDQSRGK